MDGYQLTVGIFQALAWPVAIVIISCMLRKELKSLIDRVVDLDAWGLKAKLEKTAEIVTEAFEDQEILSSSSSSGAPRKLTAAQKKILKKEILESLTPIERAVITKYYYDDKDFSQIADETAMDTEHVASIHSRVVKHLRQALSVAALGL